ncbi:50S ribosomal protein L9 [Campylobacterota bacterium]|nr:50S ribosomal protein L9 [Campylobacterota bacterium]
MKVLLIKETKGVGRAGEVKEVKDGYGQNFLIKNGLARIATDAVIRQFQAQEKGRIEAEKAALEELKALAQKLENTRVKITRKLGANGSLFGALKKEDIAEELAKQGLAIDKKEIEIDGAIKAAGVYEISAKLGRGIHPKFTIEVVGE